ncbi:MAG: methyltransferase domain-containing protein [Acidimicrobiia bacterium]
MSSRSPFEHSAPPEPNDPRKPGEMSTASSYDRLNSLLFFPTGSLKVRHRFVESVSIRRGDRVLEVGCGTGQVTQALLAAGADVVAVEQLPAMLLRARRRAPEATFVATDFRTFPAGSDCDLTVLAFVLHNFDCRVGPRSPPSLDGIGLLPG